MKLVEVINAAGARISGGDSYLWNCYGHNAQFIEFRDIDGNGYSHVIFDRNDYTCYEAHVEKPNSDIAIRWINPEFRTAFLKECKSKNINHLVAWDNVQYKEITSEKEILNYIQNFGQINYDQVG